MRHSRRQPPHWLPRATGRRGTIITIALSKSLEFTTAPGRKFIDTLDGFRKKRNVSSYDLAGAVSDKESDEMLKPAAGLRVDVEKWIRATRPELFKPKV